MSIPPATRRLIAGFLVLGGLAWAPPLSEALAAGPQPRTYANPAGYGRLSFDWDAPVGHTARIDGDTLVVTFDRPLPGPIKGTLKGYAESVEASADRRTITFKLAADKAFTVKTGVYNNVVAIDLYGKPKTTDPEAAAPPAADPAPPPASAKAAGDTGAGATRATDEALPEVTVRAAARGTGHRIVFDWPVRVSYEASHAPGALTITFSRPGRIDFDAVRKSLPAEFAGLGASIVDGKTVVTVPVAMDVKAVSFPTAKGMGVDVPRGTVPPPKPAASPAATGSPAAGPPGVGTGVRPVATPGHAGAPPVPGAPRAAPTLPVDQQSLAPPAPAPSAAAAPETLDPRVAGLPRAVSLPFPWTQPTAAAVFTRAGYLWVVFDRAQEADLKLLRRLAGDVVLYAEQIRHPTATVVRFIIQPGYNPSVRRENLLWTVDMQRQPTRTKVPIGISVEPNSSAGPRVVLAATEGSNAVTLTDPEIGDQIIAVPLIALGHGVNPERTFPDFDLLASAQGVAVVPRIDKLAVKVAPNGIEITSAAGLRLSRPRGQPISTELQSEDQGALSRVFDFPKWRGTGEDYLTDRRALALEAATAGPPDRRGAARMLLARFEFANGRAAEAIGILNLIATDEPGVTNSKAYRSLHGGANLLLNRFEEAIEDFNHPSLANNSEAAFWRAAAEASLGQPQAQLADLKANAALIADYPQSLKVRLALIGAEAALAATDDLSVQTFLDMTKGDGITPSDQAAIDYYTGRFHDLAGAFDNALASYQAAEDGPNRFYGVRARMAGTELSLKLGKLAPAEAIERLDRMRFSWRGDDFETNLLRRLAELQMSEGDYGGGLRTLKALATGFPDHPDAPKVHQSMRDAFDKLYLSGAAEKLPPVTAIALYDEFRELTPTGDKGDDMIRRLADRLVAVDLLDRAGRLLENQVRNRLKGLERAKVGTRLALVHLLDQQPQKAIDALTVSEMPGLPADLQQQRRHLTARALADLGRHEDAIVLLQGDASEDARILASEIHWKAKNWPAAAETLAGLVGPPPERGQTLPEKQARWVLDWATALTLAKDERGVSALRRGYLASVQGTPVFDGFNLITSGVEQGLIDYNQVNERARLAEGFRSFMTSYRERLKAGTLSTIN